MGLGLETRESLERRWDRLTRMKEALEEKYGDTTKFTFHGGFELGYIVGKISEIENQIDRVEESHLRFGNSLMKSTYEAWIKKDIGEIFGEKNCITN